MKCPCGGTMTAREPLTGGSPYVCEACNAEMMLDPGSLVDLCHRKPWIDTWMRMYVLPFGAELAINMGTVTWHGPAMRVLAHIEMGEFYRDGLGWGE